MIYPFYPSCRVFDNSADIFVIVKSRKNYNKRSSDRKTNIKDKNVSVIALCRNSDEYQDDRKHQGIRQEIYRFLHNDPNLR